MTSEFRRSHMRRLQIKYGTLIVISLCVFTSTSWSAQQPASETKPAPAAPIVIPVTDIIPSSEQALIQLNDIRKELEADTSVSVVDTGLPAFSDQLNQWWHGEADTIQQLGSMQRMNDVLWQLRLYEGQIATWNELLAASSKNWSAQKEGMNGLIANWKATQLALDSTAPDGIANKVGEVLLEGDFVHQLFQEKTAQLVAAQGKLAANLKRVHEIRVEVDSANVQPTGNLLSLNSPPMWKALFAAESTPLTSAPFGDGAVKLY